MNTTEENQMIWDKNQLLRGMSSTYVEKALLAAELPIKRRLYAAGHAGPRAGWGQKGELEIANARQRVLHQLVDEEIQIRADMVAANTAAAGTPDEQAAARVLRLWSHHLDQRLASMSPSKRGEWQAEVDVLKIALANAQTLHHDADSKSVAARLDELGAIPPAEGTTAWVDLALLPDVTNPSGVMATEHAAEVDRIRSKYRNGRGRK